MLAKRRVEVQEIDVGILMEREGVSRCMMDSAFPQGKFFFVVLIAIGAKYQICKA